MRVFDLLMRLYPEEFRARFEEDMRTHFQGMLERARTSGGTGAVAWLWLRTMGDMLVSGGAARLGNWTENGRGMMTGLGSRFRAAVRQMRRSPGYVAAFVLTLGLAVGVNSSVFSVVHGVLLRPLPFDDAERLLVLKQPIRGSGVENARFSFMEVDDYRSASRTIDEFVEYGDWEFTVLTDGRPHRAVGGLVTSNYFEVLGMRAAMGRLLDSGDDARGSEPVMVLTWSYWQRTFGGDPEVVGRFVELENLDQPFVRVRVVGVLERGLHYTGSRRPDFYVNYAANDHYQSAAMRDARSHRMTSLVARLAPGATLEDARDELGSIAASLHAEYSDVYPTDMGYGVRAVPWEAELSRDGRAIFLALLGTVGIVLLLAAFNLANLVLTRLIRRDRDLRTRSALGATPRDLRLQLTIENGLLGLGGGILGVLFAWLSRDALTAYAARFTVRAQEIAVDGFVLGVTLTVGIGVSVLLAWLPGLPVSPGTEGAAGARRSTDTRWRRRLQRGLVVGQLALSFALLNGSLLLVRSMMELADVEVGFRPERTVSIRVPTGPSGAPLPVGPQPEWEPTLAEIRAHPAVVSVATATWAPLGEVAPTSLGVRIDGAAEEERGAPTVANNVSLGYFDLIGIPLVAGRTFTREDDADTGPVVILSSAMARAHFGSSDPIGRRITFTPDLQNEFFETDYEIVGVVGDVAVEEPGSADRIHTYYRPAAQSQYGPEILLGTRGEAPGLTTFVREAVQRLDPSRAVEAAEPLTARLERARAPSQLNAALFGGFAGLALLIAAVGVLATLAFSVSQRIREFGIRIALGAKREEVMRSVMGEGVTMVGIALVAGGLATLVLGRLLSGLLYGVSVWDPVSVLLAAGVLGGVALGAAFVPARRATRTDPVVALRSAE
jgi:predicted permease